MWARVSPHRAAAGTDGCDDWVLHVPEGQVAVHAAPALKANTHWHGDCQGTSRHGAGNAGVCAPVGTGGFVSRGLPPHSATARNPTPPQSQLYLLPSSAEVNARTIPCLHCHTLAWASLLSLLLFLPPGNLRLRERKGLAKPTLPVKVRRWLWQGCTPIPSSRTAWALGLT